MSSELVEKGVLPILIEWPKNQHPSNKLNNSNVSLNKIALFHPEPNKIQKIICEIHSDFLKAKNFDEKQIYTLLESNGFQIMKIQEIVDKQTTNIIAIKNKSTQLKDWNEFNFYEYWKKETN